MSWSGRCLDPQPFSPTTPAHTPVRSHPTNGHTPLTNPTTRPAPHSAKPDMPHHSSNHTANLGLGEAGGSLSKRTGTREKLMVGHNP